MRAVYISTSVSGFSIEGLYINVAVWARCLFMAVCICINPFADADIVAVSMGAASDRGAMWHCSVVKCNSFCSFVEYSLQYL